MDDPDEFNHREHEPCSKSSSTSPDRGMFDIPKVQQMNSKNKKMNVHVPVINTETLNCLAIDQEITFRDSFREDIKVKSPINN